MRVVKSLATSLLGFLLVISLTVFGILFLVKQTVLNPDFITSRIDSLDISVLAEEFISEQEGEDALPEEASTALINTIAEVEPIVKDGINSTIEPVYAYLLGEDETIDLAATVRENLLTSEFATSLIDELDIASIASDMLSEQLTGDMPEELEPLMERMDEIIADLEPEIKTEIAAAADPVVDYMLGERQSLTIAISTEQLVAELEDTMLEILLESPPPELADLTPSEIEQLVDEFAPEFTQMIPATIEIDETIFPSELPEQISEALSKAEDVLAQGQEYVGYFQIGYNGFLGLIALLVIGIVLLNLQVRGATRKLGSILLSYGAIEFAGVLVAKYFAGKELVRIPNIPPSVQELLPPLVNDFLSPLQMFSLGCLIGGVVLLIVSFVYKPRGSEYAEAD